MPAPKATSAKDRQGTAPAQKTALAISSHQSIRWSASFLARSARPEPRSGRHPRLQHVGVARLRVAQSYFEASIFIGDGLRNDGLSVQQFIVPAGATRLYLGTMDGYGWWNNSGSFEVTATNVPEPATIVLVGAGLFGAVRRRVRRR
jgi:hypothetical protein